MWPCGEWSHSPSDDADGQPLGVGFDGLDETVGLHGRSRSALQDLFEDDAVALAGVVAVDLSGVERGHEVEHLGGDDLSGHEHGEPGRVRSDESGRDRLFPVLDAAAQLMRQHMLDVLAAQPRIVGGAQVAVGQLLRRVVGRDLGGVVRGEG